MSHDIILEIHIQRFINTLHPVYSKLGYSEYPLIMNGSLIRTDR
jgi:hypothetical protein